MCGEVQVPNEHLDVSRTESSWHSSNHNWFFLPAARCVACVIARVRIADTTTAPSRVRGSRTLTLSSMCRHDRHHAATKVWRLPMRLTVSRRRCWIVPLPVMRICAPRASAPSRRSCRHWFPRWSTRFYMPLASPWVCTHSSETTMDDRVHRARQTPASRIWMRSKCQMKSLRSE